MALQSWGIPYPVSRCLSSSFSVMTLHIVWPHRIGLLISSSKRSIALHPGAIGLEPTNVFSFVCEHIFLGIHCELFKFLEYFEVALMLCFILFRSFGKFPVVVRKEEER